MKREVNISTLDLLPLKMYRVPLNGHLDIVTGVINHDQPSDILFRNMQQVLVNFCDVAKSV